MRKIISSILVAAVLSVTFLSGCSGKQVANTTSAGSTISSEETGSSEVSSEAVSSQAGSSSAVSPAASAATTVKANTTNNNDAGNTCTTVKTTAPVKTAAVVKLAPKASPVKSSVPSGGYSTKLSVKLSTATAGAAIYYTANGSAPSTHSTRYTGPITVSGTTTIKAVAYKSGLALSDVSSFSYVYNKLSGNVVTDGSTALQPLLNLAAPMFKSKYASVFSGAVNIGGGGSGQGLTDVESGTVLVGDSDVTVAQAGKNFTDLVDHPVCTVAVAIVVSADVANHFGNNGITIGSLKKIYEGAYTNWNQVPGSGNYDKPIMVCYRKAGSGTRCLFETFGVGEKFNENADYVKNNDAFVYTNASADLQAQVGNNQGAIGYETMPYVSSMRKLKVDFGRGPVDCTYANVDNGSYKIWGYEHLYTKGQAKPTAQAFIDFVMSQDFQSTILANGYGLSGDVPDSVGASHK